MTSAATVASSIEDGRIIFNDEYTATDLLSARAVASGVAQHPKTQLERSSPRARDD